MIKMKKEDLRKEYKRILYSENFSKEHIWLDFKRSKSDNLKKQKYFLW